MSGDGTRLPGCLAEFAEAIGVGNAAAIGRRWPGLRLRVPRHLNTRTGRDLVECIGVEAAHRLCQHFGGERFDIPIWAAAAPSKKARIARAKGTAPEVALNVGATERYVRMVRNMGGDGRQKSLFETD